MRRSLHRTFFRPERPTLTSRSLQFITRPFQKRFREVFGNARILIFYLSIKAWEEKSLPKSHLGWFFLVFGEGKATKENMSIFWFIWPLNSMRMLQTRACIFFGHRFHFDAFSTFLWLSTLRVDSTCHVIFTCVKFTFPTNIEAMHERLVVSVTVEPRSTSRLI